MLCNGSEPSRSSRATKEVACSNHAEGFHRTPLAKGGSNLLGFPIVFAFLLYFTTKTGKVNLLFPKREIFTVFYPS